MIRNFITYKVIIAGIVQGVGFRPFIYKTAKESNLTGSVTNTTEGVFIRVNVKNKKDLINFIENIKKFKPAPSVIEKVIYKQIPFEDFKNFSINKSFETEEKFQLVSPDIATCKNCIEDINNKSNKRRFYYPFTNCTNCGPRFTIIKKMPYDRVNTTMADFDLCPDCLKEYNSPFDRRFHAQPNACNICGPGLKLIDRYGNLVDDKNPISAAAEKLKNGIIIGLKSLGGFQIACDATNDKPVLEIRKRKNRPYKPFALMFSDIKMIKEYLEVNIKEIEILTSAAAPIVLLLKKKESKLSRQISHYNKYEGALLPYTPIHHLLFNNITTPLVMTSGNISEEPIASENGEALEKLAGICDYFLIHNRDIYSKYDDSVIKIFNNKEMIIRRARGYAPYPVKIDIDIGNKVILAVGAQEKNTFCLLKKNYAIISQHVGDLDSLDSIDFFKSTLENYRKLFNINKIDIVVYDNHPDYTSTKFALKHFKNLKKIGIQHHKVHIASVIAENKLFSPHNKSKKILGFAWDGTGYGDDGKIWGSEIFIVDNNLNFERIGHLKEKHLPGGEITIKKPYRMALVYLYNLWTKKSSENTGFADFIFENFPIYKKIINPAEIKIIKKQIETGFNSPYTTSMGRFFDAASSILNLTHIASYEGEAAVHLEMNADENISEEYDIKLSNSHANGVNNVLTNENKTGVIVIDDFYIFQQIVKDIKNKIYADVISAKFHNTLAKIILIISKKVKDRHGIDIVTLSGGVFQNNYLLKRCYDNLQDNSFKVYSNFKVPVNDGGISLGQAYIAAKSL
jgi:hydrogenase maturation protein HypF